MKTLHCRMQTRFARVPKISAAVLTIAMFGILTARAQLFWNTNGVAGNWTDPNWSASVAGPFTTVWTANSDVEFTTNSTLTFATTSIGNVTVDSNQTVTVTAGGTLSMGSGVVRTFNIGTGALLTWQSQIINANSHAGITKNGLGTLDLGALTFATAMDGGFTLNGGTVIASGNKSFGSGSLTINGGTLQSSGTKTFTATSLVIGGNCTFSGTSSATFGMPVNLGSATPIITNITASGSRIFTGAISGNPGVGINFVGTGAAQFYFNNSASTFSGPVIITGTNSTPEIGFANDRSFGAIPGSVTPNAIVIDGGRLTASGTSGNPAGYILNSNRGIQVGATPGTSISVISVPKTNGFLAYNGVIADKPGSAGILVKQGAGTLALGGTNTYTGATTINNGILLINGKLTASPIIINSGTLGGFGTINGIVTNASGGILAPGAGVNTAGTVLTLATNLTLQTGGTNLMQISFDDDTNDMVVCGGKITYGGALVVITNGMDSAAFTNGEKFTLFVTNGSSGGYAGSFTSSNFPPLSSGLAWSNSLSVDGSIEVVSNAMFTPMPTARFSGTPTNGFAPLKVTFINMSTGSFTNSAWSFGDGNVTTNTSAANVTNTYAAAGTYTVSLTVAGLGGGNTGTSNNYIVVKPQPVLGIPAVVGGTNFIFSGTNGPAGAAYSILGSTNVALPLANWTPLVTNVFSSDGSYSYTNTPPTNIAQFFRLKSPP